MSTVSPCNHGRPPTPGRGGNITSAAAREQLLGRSYPLPRIFTRGSRTPAIIEQPPANTQNHQAASLDLMDTRHPKDTPPQSAPQADTAPALSPCVYGAATSPPRSPAPTAYP